MTTLTRLGSWPLGVAWVLLALLAGPTGADALADAPTAVAIGIAVAAWGCWGAVVVALLVPRTLSLTVVRGLVPLAPVAAVAAAAVGSDATPLDAAVLAVATFAATWAFAPFVTDGFVDGSSYGPERRFALRTAVPVAAAAIVTWSIAVGLLAAAVALAAHERWLPAVLLAALAAGAAVVVARSLHQLSQRWLVLVPTGLVLHDPLALAEPQLFPRRAVRALGPAAAELPTDAATVDLSGGAAGLVLALDLAEPVELLLRRGSEAITVPADRVLFTPLRPATTLASARDHRLPVSGPSA